MKAEIKITQVVMDYTETEILEWSRAWRVRGSVPRPVNWVLAEKYRPHGDPTADIEYQARAEKAWAKAREINIGGK